jgi:uncharacterized protein YkwD
VYGTHSDLIKKYAGVDGGENIAKDVKYASAAVYTWMRSSGHKANILNSKYTHIGIGITEDEYGRYYWVQHFAKIK